MGVDPFTAALGVGVASAGAGAYGQHKASKAQAEAARRARMDIFEHRNLQLTELEQGLGEQERLLKKALREENVGIEESINRFEGTASRNIERERGRAMGEVKSALAGSGLFGSSVQGNLNLGVSRQTSDRYTTLGEAVAGMRTALAQKQGMGQRELGSLRAYKSQAKQGVYGNAQALLAGQAASQNYTAQQPDFGGIGAMLGLAALYGGGPSFGSTAAGGALATSQTYKTYNQGTGLGSMLG